MIALACDHTGVAMKQEIMKLLDEMGLAWKDFGNYDADNRDDDYPVYVCNFFNYLLLSILLVSRVPANWIAATIMMMTMTAAVITPVRNRW